MATVTIYYTNGTSSSFETHDPDVIHRHQGSALTDPEISSVNVQN